MNRVSDIELKVNNKKRIHELKKGCFRTPLIRDSTEHMLFSKLLQVANSTRDDNDDKIDFSDDNSIYVNNTRSFSMWIQTSSPKYNCIIIDIPKTDDGYLEIDDATLVIGWVIREYNSSPFLVSGAAASVLLSEEKTPMSAVAVTQMRRDYALNNLDSVTYVYNEIERVYEYVLADARAFDEANPITTGELQ